VKTSSRTVTLVMLALSIALLLPGIFLPVLTIRGVLTKEGVAYDKGLNEETMKTLSSLINPQMISMVKALGGDLRKMIIDRLGPQLSKALQDGVDNVEVYQQTRSIVGAVRQLYDVGSPLPATLILLFSVVVPLTKAALVAAALYMRNAGAGADAPLRRSHRQVVHGRRLRGGAVHRLPGGAGLATAARRP
jgi:hypothetical protein